MTTGSMPIMRLYDWVHRSFTNLEGTCRSFPVTSPSSDALHTSRRPECTHGTSTTRCPTAVIGGKWNGRPRASSQDAAADTLGAFDRHILTSQDPNRNNESRIDFVGYNAASRQDFLVYKPGTNDKKEVTFDVSSFDTNAHTLDGAGFLVNTRIHNGSGVTDPIASSNTHISGYLLYYVFPNAISMRARPSHLVLYKLDNVLLSNLRVIADTQSPSNQGVIKANNILLDVPGITPVTISTGDTQTSPVRFNTLVSSGPSAGSINSGPTSNYFEVPAIRVSDVNHFNYNATTPTAAEITSSHVDWTSWNDRNVNRVPNWTPEMSIRLTITRNSISVKHKNATSTAEWEDILPVLTYNGLDTANNRGDGFGPYVGYNRHGCNRASIFTFLKLEMEYTPQLKLDEVVEYLNENPSNPEDRDYAVNLNNPFDPETPDGLPDGTIYFPIDSGGKDVGSIVDEITKKIVDDYTNPDPIPAGKPWARLMLMHKENPFPGEREANTVGVINLSTAITNATVYDSDGVAHHGINLQNVYGFDTATLPLSIPSQEGGDFVLTHYYYLIKNPAGQPINSDGTLATTTHTAPDGRQYTAVFTDPNHLLLNINPSIPANWPLGTYTVDLFVQDNSTTNDFSENTVRQTFEITNNSTVHIDVRLDDMHWNNFGDEHDWVDKHKIPKTVPGVITISDGTNTFSVDPATGDAKNVPAGIYKIYVDGKDTGQQVVVPTPPPPTETGLPPVVTGRLDYYSVTLIAIDPGTSAPKFLDKNMVMNVTQNVPDYEAIAIYLPGTNVTVDVSFVETYHFYGWGNEYDPDKYSSDDKSFTFTTPKYSPRKEDGSIGKDLLLTAYAVGSPDVDFVFISYDEDKEIWDDDTPDVYLIGPGGKYGKDAWGSLPPGEYDVYIDEKGDGTGEKIDKKVIIEAGKYPRYVKGDGTPTLPVIYYYVLTLVAEPGTVDPLAKGGHVPFETEEDGRIKKYRFREGTVVDIGVSLTEGSEWIIWESIHEWPDIATRDGTVTMPKNWLRFHAIAGFKAELNLNLDDKPWDGTGEQPAKPKIILRPTDGGPDIEYTDGTVIPAGSYKVIIIDDGKIDELPDVFTVGPGQENKKTIDYYTLRLEGDDGIAAVFGGGRYRAGVEVTISADLLAGFNWRLWSEMGGGVQYNATTNTYTLIMPARTLVIRATTGTGTPTSTTPPGRSPQTGVTNIILIPALMILLGGGCITGAEVYRRRKRKQ